jgi:DHA1 family tetracycline resistance protein-like MFS transporter
VPSLPPTPEPTSEPSAGTAGARRPAIAFVLFTLFLDVLGFGLLIPVAPKLIQGLLNNGQGGTEQEAAIYYGALPAIYAFMMLIFAPILGALSDKYGRRPVLLFSIFGSGLDYFVMAFSPTLWLLFLARALNGISGASMAVCNAYIADITLPEKRAGAFGMIGAVFGLGFIIGPALGGLLGGIDIHLPFYVAGGLSLVNWCYGLFVLPESLPPERRSGFTLAKANPFSAIIGLGRYPLVARLAASLFMLNVAMFGLHVTWALYTAHRFGWSPTQIGLSLTCVGVGAALVQGGLARKLIPLLGEERSVLVGMVIGVVAYVAYGSATQGWMIYAFVLIASLGGIAGPALQAIITKSVLPTEQGAVQGAMSGLNSIASIIGPLVGSQVFAYFISDRAPAYVPGAALYASAVFAFVALVLAEIAFRREGVRSGKVSQGPGTQT